MEKHRAAVDFQFQDGAFRPLTVTEPLQLYRVFESEAVCGAKTSFCVPVGMKLLIVCTLGTGRFHSNGGSAVLKEATALICEAGTYEFCTDAVCPRSELICLLFDVYSQQTMSAPFDLSVMTRYFQGITGVMTSDHAVEVCRCFQELLSELSLPEPTMLLAKGYFYQIMTEAHRQFTRNDSAQGNREIEMNAVGQTVYAIVCYIDENLFSINNLMDMAQELGYSYNYLSHLFRRKTGMTIQAYVTQKKIEQSTRLLLDEQYSITEIAAMLNYDCIQSFSKAFRRAMGVSPTEYRGQAKSRVRTGAS